MKKIHCIHFFAFILLNASSTAVYTQDRYVFQEWARISNTGSWILYTGEFNDDEKLDIAGYHPESGEIWVGTNTGSKFDFGKKEWAKLSPGKNWTFLTGHFAGDSTLDFIGYQPETGKIKVGVNEGTRFAFSDWGTVSPTNGWVFLTGEFGGDTKLDLVGYHPASGKILTEINMGSGFTPGKTTMVKPLSNSIGWIFLTGDFAGDEKPDLIINQRAGKRDSSEIQVGVNTGDGFAFNKWARLSSFVNWTFRAGEFTGDSSKLDLVGYNSGEDIFWVGTNTGNEFTFANWFRVSPDLGKFNMTFFSTGEFSGDGRLDIAAFWGGAVYIGANRSTKFKFSRLAPVTPPKAWRILSGNFTGDLRPDLVVYFPGNGSIWMGKTKG